MMRDVIFRDVHCILGLPFDEITLQDSVDYLRESITLDKRCFLSTPNLNFAIATQADDVFFQSVVDSDLNVADGMPLIWVAKLLGIPISERVAGSTLFEELLTQQNKAEKIKVFFFGGQEGIAELAHHKLNKNSATKVSCGFYDPGFVSVEEMSSSKIVAYINSCQPDFIVVALGAKKGQQWIQQNKNELDAAVISHLGAVINFVAGNVERAPILWQRLGLEWVWRIRQEPVLWQRYLSDGLSFLKLMLFNVLPLAIYDRILRRTASYREACKIGVVKGERITIRLTGSIHCQVIAEFKQVVANVINNENDVVLDFLELNYIDSAFIATLLLIQRHLNKQGCSLVLDNASSRIIRILRLSSVLKRFTLS